MMLSQVCGAAEFRAALQTWSAEGERGEVPSVPVINQWFVDARPVEISSLLASYVSDGVSPEGAYLAYIVLAYEQATQEDRSRATGYLLSCLSPECGLRTPTLRLLNGLDRVPSEFRSAIEDALDSGSEIDRLIAAGVAGKFGEEEFDPLRKAGLLALRGYLHHDSSGVLAQAIVAMSSYRVRPKELNGCFLRFLRIAAEDEIAMVCAQVSAFFCPSEEAIAFLMSQCEQALFSERVRGYIYLSLGRLFPDRVRFGAWLADRLFVDAATSTNPELLMLIGSGIALQKHAFNERTATKLVALLRSPDEALRIAAAVAIAENKRKLSRETFHELAQVVHSDASDLVRQKLIDCFAHGSKEAIPVAMAAAAVAARFAKPVWIGSLAHQASRHPSAFYECYAATSDPSLEELMPHILTQGPNSGRILEEIRKSLASCNELERFNALFSMKNADKRSASASPELMDIYLYGRTDERIDARDILLRIGSDAAVHLEGYTNLRDELDGDRFAALLRVLKAEGARVGDPALIRFRRPELIRRFVLVANVVEECGPVGHRRIGRLLTEKGVALAKSAQGNERAVLQLMRDFPRSLAASLKRPLDDDLFASTTRGQVLTAYGEEWLRRCKQHLASLDS